MGCATSSSKNTSGGLSAASDFEEARRWRDEVVVFRRRFLESMQRSQALVTRRPDVYCEMLVEPWRPGEHYDVGDLFHSTFKKSSMEINIAFKGGRYKHESLFYNYGRSIVIVLRSKSSGSVCSACLLVKHATDSGEVFEMIWFATRERKQNAGLGTCLFRRCCQATSASGAKGLVITANDNVACWWISLSKDVSALRLHPTVIRSGKDATGVKRAAEKGHNKRMSKIPQFNVSHTPDASVGGFYQTGSGAPFRYDFKNTTHIWYVKGSLDFGSKNNSNSNRNKERSRKDGRTNTRAKNEKNGTASRRNRDNRNSSKYKVEKSRTGDERKRPSFRTAGVAVKGAMRFKNSGRTGSRQ